MKQKLHERLGLSVEETLERLLALRRLMHQHERIYGEKLNLKHLDAILHANTAPVPTRNDT